MTRTRTIQADITPHRITLSGDTYPLRNDIRAHGFLWNAADQTWSTAYKPELETYARSIATATVFPPASPDVPGRVRTMTIDQLQDTLDPAPRRRIKRTADIDQTQPTQNQQAPDIAAALAAFVATIQPQQTPQASAIDLAQVQELIDAAVTKAMATVQTPPATRVDITSDGQTIRSVNGLHHEMLPTLIKCLSAGLHVWLAGPSGSGKTHGAEQAAQALGLTFRLQGAMTMAHELTGFVDAGGKYHETPFVATFRNGGVILLDELDAGSNEALLALNAALANGIMCLPSGEIIRAHADFKCVGAANTFGQGATADYVGRTRIDAAFLQRFGARLTWAYDEKLETAMSGNVDWSARVQRARKAAKANGLKVLITPRASQAGAKLIAAGFTPDEAASMTYLADLSPDQRRMIEH